MANKRVKDIMSRFKGMKDIRKPHEARMKAVSEYILPNREILMHGREKKGEKTHAQIFDGSPEYAFNMMCNCIVGYTASASFKWFKKRMAKHELNEKSEVKKWLQEAEEIHYAELQNSNFYSSLGQFVRDGASVFAGMYVDEDLKNDELVFQVLHPWELFISRDKSGRVDTVYRDYWMTARNSMKFYGKDKLPKDIRKSAEDEPEKEYEFLNAICPSEDFTLGLADIRGKPIISEHIAVADEKYLLKKGYDSMPIITWSWALDSGETYPRTPASDALKDIMMLNQMSRTNLVTAQKMSDMPMRAPLEERGYIDLRPGGISWYEGALPKPIAPIMTALNVPLELEMIQRVEDIINRRFYVDIFLMLQMSDQKMTATEIIERQGEKFPALAPIMSRFYRALYRILSRSFELLYRAGKIPDPPQILQDNAGEKIEVVYLGPLAQAQMRLFKTQGINQSLDQLDRVFVYAPETRDKFDWDGIAEDVAEGGGMPEKNIRPDDEVEKIRKIKAEQIRQQQDLENAEKLAGATSKMSKKVEPGSPIEQMIGAAGGS